MIERELWDWVDLGDSEGSMDRPSRLPIWFMPPKVTLDGEWLTFHRPIGKLRRGGFALQASKVGAGRGLLTEFVTLDDAPADQILEYARRYGPLGFCQHGDPNHRLGSEGCLPMVVPARKPNEAGQVREAVQWWRNLAGHARALLNVAAQLSKGKVEPITLVRLNPELIFSSRKQFRAAQRNPASFVAYGLDLWLRYFQVRPRISYNPRRKRFETHISGRPAFPGALALQLLLAITRSLGVAVCSSCGKPFRPSRRPNPNRNCYCKACGIKAAWREAQARRRQKK
ncbi:MAG: hypothetical protein ACLQU2_07865 [Candidatus Binataceae bacterium]